MEGIYGRADPLVITLGLPLAVCTFVYESLSSLPIQIFHNTSSDFCNYISLCISFGGHLF